MRPTYNIFDKENRRRRGEGDSVGVDTWKVVPSVDRKEAASNLMTEFFGDVLTKLKRVIDKDKSDLKKYMSIKHRKNNGNKT